MDLHVDEWTDHDAVHLSEALIHYVAHQPRPESPNARQARRALRQCIRHLATTLGDSSPVRGGANDDGHDVHDVQGAQDAQDDEQDARDAQGARTQAGNKVRARHELLLTAARARPPLVTAAALSRLIIDGVHDGRHGVVENEALIRAISGYALPANPNVWPDFPIAAGAVPIAALCVQAAHLRRGALTVDAVVAREKLIASDPTGHRWTRAVFDKIEAILLLRQVQERRTGRGGATWHKGITKQRFEAWLGAQTGGARLYADNIDRARDDYQPAFAQAKKTFDQLMTEEQRNRHALHDMYMQFGPAVLLDPLWTAANCHSRRSRDFRGLLHALQRTPLTDADGLNPFRQAYERTCLALCSLAAHLGGADFNTYVVDFLVAAPSHVAG
ncbi:hypothetical protein FA95DRAFT_1662791 [Auriscalpium vulgare]|uniref:Uncharacterized protein n=1 Tax=Auriscalpium vulgare TaxID=40419 RepID=A0ACB8R3J3_9AGAM|nr:hypothetical protein FA95DRAFT_1662791 [Auriscalpium vulgare]